MNLLVVGFLALVLGGCGTYYLGSYREEISANQRGLSKLQLRMSSQEVRSTMGEGEIINYKRLYLVDPWRSESFSLVDGEEVLILFYVTQPPRKYYSPQDNELTPIVLENGAVVGWGWSFLKSNSDRYRISQPRQQW